MDLPNVEVVYTAPSAEEFVALREVAGMYPRLVSSAEKGLYRCLFSVALWDQGTLIGTGRVVGDGATAVQITEIAVHPDYQNRGCGSFIFDQIQTFIDTEIPDDALVCLFAAIKTVPFYQARGFVVSECCPGMYWPRLERIKIKNGG